MTYFVSVTYKDTPQRAGIDEDLEETAQSFGGFMLRRRTHSDRSGTQTRFFEFEDKGTAEFFEGDLTNLAFGHPLLEGRPVIKIVRDQKDF